MSALPTASRSTVPRRGPAGGRRPALFVVVPPSRARRYVTVIVVLAALGVFGSVTLNALAAEQAFAARSLQAEVKQLTMQSDELTVEIAALEAPDRVRRLATTKLGMVPAEQPAYLVLRGNRAARLAAADG